MKNIKSLIIIFPLETKIRELHSKLFLVYKIINNLNCKVIIGSQRDIFNNIIYIKNTIWIDKNTYYKKIIRNKLLEKNFRILLDEEGPHSFHDKHQTLLRISKKLLNFFHFILIWGKEDLKKISTQKKYCFGHPKYDLLKKNYKNIYTENTQEIKKKYGEFILINSSFEFDSDDDNLINNVMRINIEKYNKEEFKINLEFKRRYQNYLKQIKLVERLASDNANINFIYRPHPYQNLEKVKKRFKKIDNLKIIFKNTTTPWIMACKLFIHSGCSTYLEAFALKKKIINFFPIKTNHYKKFCLAGETFEKEERLCDFVKNYLKKETNKKLSSNIKIFNTVENIKPNKFFYKEFINFIYKNFKYTKSVVMYGKYIKRNKKYQKIKEIFLTFLSNIKSLTLKIRFITKFLPESLLYSKEYKLKKFNYFRKSEIVDIFKRLDSIEKKKNLLNIKIQKISNNVFEIYKK
jgi:surface carbohydrate biosynthesis protein